MRPPEWQRSPDNKDVFERTHPADSKGKVLTEVLLPSLRRIARTETYPDGSKRITSASLDTDPEPGKVPQNDLVGQVLHHIMHKDDHLEFPFEGRLWQAVYFADPDPMDVISMGFRNPIIIDYTLDPQAGLTGDSPINIQYAGGRLIQCRFLLDATLEAERVARFPLWAEPLLDPETSSTNYLFLDKFKRQSLDWLQWTHIGNCEDKEVADNLMQIMQQLSQGGSSTYPFSFRFNQTAIEVNRRANRLSLYYLRFGRFNLELEIPTTLPYQQIKDIFENPQADFRTIQTLLGLKGKRK